MKLTNAQGRELLNKQRNPVAKWGKSGPTESQQQAECVAWFRAQYPELAQCLFSIPNGGFRSKRTAATIKREGAVPGIPDLFLATPKNGYSGLFIEMKTAKGKLSEKQVQMLATLSVHNYSCKVVYSIEEFKQVIAEYLG